MKLLFITGSRGEWGYIRPVLEQCVSRGYDYRLCVTNMHRLPAYGHSIDDIRQEGFEVTDPIYMALEGNNLFTQAKSLGIGLLGLVDVIDRHRPDWIILAGDRGEQLVAAVAAAYTYTPAAHIQAGELSGNIDGMARHAIDKLVHLHFAANQDAADRLIKLGEEPFRVKVVGAPQLDDMIAMKPLSRAELADAFQLPDGPFLLVVQHPVTEEYGKAREQAAATLAALRRFPVAKVWILPNNDAGGRDINRIIEEESDFFIRCHRNLPRRAYLGLLKECAAIVGNSSSGLLEAPTYGIPAVNIGRRQQWRYRGRNVIDVERFEPDAIALAMEKGLSEGFRRSLEGLENPYGDGHSAARILDILTKTPRDATLLAKHLTY